MERLQKAALNLHGMHAADREWMLEQLSASHRKPLVEMLDELDDLGIPREPILLDEIAAAPQQAYERNQIKLWNYSAAQLWQVLEPEPNAVIWGLLNGIDWPWCDELLQLMPEERRAAIEERLVSESSPTDTAFAALCEMVADRLNDLDVGDVRDEAPEQRSWFRRLPWRG